MYGWLEVVCGPMFSGKTEELIRRVRRAQIARQKIQIFKPSIDTRYSQDSVVSHSAQAVEGQVVNHALDILTLVKDTTRVVAIDEVQFFTSEIIEVVQKLTRRGLRVICAGLDLDYLARPFGSMGSLLALADEVYKLHAICTVCGQPATRSQRLAESREDVLLGAFKAYEARCKHHYEEEHEQLNFLEVDAPWKSSPIAPMDTTSRP